MRTLQQELAKKLNVVPMPVKKVKKVNVEVKGSTPLVGISRAMFILYLFVLVDGEKMEFKYV